MTRRGGGTGPPGTPRVPPPVNGYAASTVSLSGRVPYSARLSRRGRRFCASSRSRPALRAGAYTLHSNTHTLLVRTLPSRALIAARRRSITSHAAAHIRRRLSLKHMHMIATARAAQPPPPSRAPRRHSHRTTRHSRWAGLTQRASACASWTRGEAAAEERGPVRRASWTAVGGRAGRACP